MLPELLNQIPSDQEIGITADGAFDARKCHDAIAARSATAIIPPRKNAKPWKPDSPGRLRETRRLARRNASVELSRDDGAVFTAEAASKPKCIVSNCWANV